MEHVENRVGIIRYHVSYYWTVQKMLINRRRDSLACCRRSIYALAGRCALLAPIACQRSCCAVTDVRRPPTTGSCPAGTPRCLGRNHRPPVIMPQPWGFLLVFGGLFTAVFIVQVREERQRKGLEQSVSRQEIFQEVGSNVYFPVKRRKLTVWNSFSRSYVPKATIWIFSYKIPILWNSKRPGLHTTESMWTFQ
jgi:hypothetical protein